MRTMPPFGALRPCAALQQIPFAFDLTVSGALQGECTVPRRAPTAWSRPTIVFAVQHIDGLPLDIACADNLKSARAQFYRQVALD